MTREPSPDQLRELKLLVEEQMQLGNASKRARDVARIILEQGSCTTSDIEKLGYKHAPRAVGDLRDSGVQVVKEMEAYVDADTHTKKRRARYTIQGVVPGKKSRHSISKKTADAVKASGKCEVCGAPPPLQVDHRVPFEIGGERYPHVISDLMPLCPSCNRTKSWACEGCLNRENADINVCQTCMWASPRKYQHVAMHERREIRIALDDPEDVRRYDRQRVEVKRLLVEYMRRNEEK